jgi:uncharacterized cupredoxin-like copper-binding protein
MMPVFALYLLLHAFWPNVLLPSARADVSGMSEIIIRERIFRPPVLTLPLGELVTLVVRNEDGEIHAFVPLLWLQGTNVQVGGNGAPEFNETGFARVLIPPHGRAELIFRPKTAGRFFYICDLPGHNMRGEIVVPGGGGHDLPHR